MDLSFITWMRQWKSHLEERSEWKVEEAQMLLAQSAWDALES